MEYPFIDIAPLWPEVLALDRVLSMGKIELKCVLMLSWIIWNGTVFDIETVLRLTELFEIELLWHLTVCKQKFTYTKINCLN